MDVVSYVVVQENPGECILEYPEYDGRYHNRYRLGGCKIVLDGSPQGPFRVASRLTGETEYRGYPVFRDDEVDAYVRACVENGRQLLAHCNRGRGGGPVPACVPEGRRAFRKPRPYGAASCDDTPPDGPAGPAGRNGGASHDPVDICIAVYYWGDVHVKNLGRDARRISAWRVPSWRAA